MAFTLSLYEDVLANGSHLVRLSERRPQMIYVVHGSILIEGQVLADGNVWFGEHDTVLIAGDAGATIWRWEIAPTSGVRGSVSGEGFRSCERLSASLDSLPSGELLLRGDSVAFPPGGCAYKHVHQGPGIRCLLEGGIRIDTCGRSTSFGPGGGWYEPGPEPVFAQAAPDRPSRFVRVMILPRSLLGQSSIRYVDQADRDKPKSQSYQVFVDQQIRLPNGER